MSLPPLPAVVLVLCALSPNAAAQQTPQQPAAPAPAAPGPPPPDLPRPGSEQTPDPSPEASDSEESSSEAVSPEAPSNSTPTPEASRGADPSQVGADAQPDPAEAAELREIEAALAADAAVDEGSDANAAPGLGAAASPGATQSLNPDISLIFDMALAYFSDEDNLQTGHHDPTANGFNLQQLELSFASPVSPYLRLDSHIVFSEEGVEPEEIYATTLGLPWALQARFGEMLSHFGRVNEQHPHQWKFVDQPFALGRVFGGDGNRGLGVELSWLSPLPWYLEVIGSVTNADGEGARSFQGEDGDGIQSLADLLYVTALEQFFALNDDWSLYWGLSAALGPNPSFEDARTDVFGTDLYLKYRPVAGDDSWDWSLQSEWLLRRRQVPEGELEDVGGYAETLLRFAWRWGAAVRYEFGSPERVDGATPASALDPDWTRARHRTSANVTFWPTEFSRFRLQGALDNPRWRGDPIYSLFLNAEVAIGAHGAHSF